MSIDSPSTHGSDPFADHAEISSTPEQNRQRSDTQDERDFITEATLAVGRNATLTLGTDALIVLGKLTCVHHGSDADLLDDGFQENPRTNCCGLIPARKPSLLSLLP